MNCKKTLCIAIAAMLSLVLLPVRVNGGLEASTASVVWFDGEKSAAAWANAVTVNTPDTDVLTDEYMAELEWSGNAAPSLAFSSWNGGKSWATVMPCENLGGKLYYSYEDICESFGDDLSLVDSVSVTARGAAITVYKLSLVSSDWVRAQLSAVKPVRRVVGYLPDWAYQCYKTLDYSSLTHINIAFGMPDADGSLSCMIPDSELKNIVALAHENNVRVLISLGGAGNYKNFPELTATDAARDGFNVKIMSFCEKYGLDGVDLDIESSVSAAFWGTYEAWCVSLRECCDKRGYLLTTATACWLSMSASNVALQCFDFLNVMAYDNDGDDTSHSDYDFAVESLEFFRIERGISIDRLVLGVPFYGRGYNDDGTLSWTSYEPFSKLVIEDKDNYSRDFYNGIAYNGSETMTKKCALASNYGGVMIWELSQDAAGEYSLLSLIGGELLREASDAAALKRYLLGVSSAGYADVNDDGKCDSLDLCLLLRAAGLSEAASGV